MLPFWRMQALLILVAGLFLTLSAFVTGARLIEEKLDAPSPSITATSTPTAKPTIKPTYKSQVKGAQAYQTPIPTTDPNPIVTCQFEHIPVRQMKSSECKKSTECQLFQGGEWFFSPSVEDCKQKQQTYYGQPKPAFAQPTNAPEVPESEQVVDCIVPPECGGGSYRWLKSSCDKSFCCQTSTGAYFIDEETCKYFQEIDAELSKAQPEQIIDCIVPFECGGGSHRLPKTECDKYVCCPTNTGAYFIKSETCRSFLETDVEQAIEDIERAIENIESCKAKVNSRYNDLINSCSIQFGGSSGVEACERATNKEREKELQKCEGN